MGDERDPRAGRPKSWDEAYAQLQMTPEEEAELAREGGPPEAVAEGEEAQKVPDPLTAKADDPGDPDAVPDWVVLPPAGSGFRLPPAGKRVQFMRFRAEWTDAPLLGDRVAICWTLSSAEEKIAIRRGGSDSVQIYAELAKQTIRAIDGAKVDWSGKPGKGNIARFWEEIGPSCRQAIVNVYHSTHTLRAEQRADFFLNCFVSRSAVAG